MCMFADVVFLYCATTDFCFDYFFIRGTSLRLRPEFLPMTLQSYVVSAPPFTLLPTVQGLLSWHCVLRCTIGEGQEERAGPLYA